MVQYKKKYCTVNFLNNKLIGGHGLPLCCIQKHICIQYITKEMALLLPILKPVWKSLSHKCSDIKLTTVYLMYTVLYSP